MREFGTDEFLCIADPLVHDAAHESAFGKQAGPHKNETSIQVHTKSPLNRLDCAAGRAASSGSHPWHTPGPRGRTPHESAKNWLDHESKTVAPYGASALCCDWPVRCGAH